MFLFFYNIISMDLIEDEPRKHPKPVPFCQSSLLQPAVPEVSLILQDKFNEDIEKKNDSFSGTEFQTYNAWRWKQTSLKDTAGVLNTKTIKKCSSIQDCCLVKDKYSSSDIEKRKNEILYGQLDEPRRPLPPRASPVIPKCTDSFFCSPSFHDSKIDEERTERHHNSYNSLRTQEKDLALNHINLRACEKESTNSEKLYNIIAEQNKQTEIIQKQIEQLLKLQEVKDKQIEQLLKTQESKEKKIEHLLQTLEEKNKEVEQLLKLKMKQEHQLQELIKSQEIKQQENVDLLKKLNQTCIKDVCTIGTMTNLKTVEASTNTSFNCTVREQYNKNIVEQDISCIRDLNDTNNLDGKDRTLSLHSSDLPVIQEHIPTPQSSIHVDIQDFDDSSSESDSSSKTLENGFPNSTEVQKNSLGYTFYNNVLTQVKNIIQKPDERENNKNVEEKLENCQFMRTKPFTECGYVAEQRGTVQSFQAWGVFGRENNPFSNEGLEKNQFEERFQYESPNLGSKDNCSPSDISLKMNALALKYLKQEQISQYDVHPQISNPCQREMTIYNVTNLSIGSMRYLDRYKITPKLKETQYQDINFQPNEHSPAQLLQRKKKMSLQQNFSPPVGKVLDMSTLNKQPKLL